MTFLYRPHRFNSVAMLAKQQRLAVLDVLAFLSGDSLLVQTISKELLAIGSLGMSNRESTEEGQL